MSDLVVIKNNQVVVSSRKVAESFQKLHKTILRNVKEILAAQNCATKFYKETHYINRGKRYVEYLMNRDGFMLLVMGFTGKVAIDLKIAYINAFNEMEKQLKEKQQAAAKIPPVQQTLPLPEPEYVRPYECMECMQRLEEIKGIANAAQVMVGEMECGRKKSELEAAWRVIADIFWKAGGYSAVIAKVKMPTYPTLE